MRSTASFSEPSTTPTTVWTIGHSTRPLEEFLQLLDAHRVQRVVDVRRHPGSRRLPQYGEAALSAALQAHGVAYHWAPALGGRRRPRADSPNDGWRNESFRGYADHIGTDEFAAGLEELLGFAREQRTALMCAEAVWWRCHRALIADVLRVRGVEVLHILGPGHVAPHPFTSVARIVNGELSYAKQT